MNHLDISFEESPWERWLNGVQPGQRISAAHLLTMLEAEQEDAMDDALQLIENGGMELDVSDLPQNVVSGNAAVRLRQEIQMAKDGLQLENLGENDPLRLFLEEVAAAPSLGDEVLLAQQAAQGSEKAMEQLTNLGLRQVVQLAREYVGRGVLLLDLIQEGSLGLWRAICDYRDGDYAAVRDHWIRLYMAKAIVQQAHANGLGQKLRIAMEDYRAVDERLLSDLGRNPTLEEIAQELHISQEETDTIRRMLENTRRMEKVHPEEEAPEESAEDEQAVENTALFQMRQRIADLLCDLPEQDQQLLTLRFGLEGGLPMSVEDTGRKLGLTAQEVVAREGAALAKLREKT